MTVPASDFGWINSWSDSNTRAKWKCCLIYWKALPAQIEMLDGTRTRQSHPLLIKNGNSQGSSNTLGYLMLQIKTVFHMLLLSEWEMVQKGRKFSCYDARFLENDTIIVGALRDLTTSYYTRSMGSFLNKVWLNRETAIFQRCGFFFIKFSNFTFFQCKKIKEKCLSMWKRAYISVTKMRYARYLMSSRWQLSFFTLHWDQMSSDIVSFAQP